MKKQQDTPENTIAYKGLRSASIERCSEGQACMQMIMPVQDIHVSMLYAGRLH